LGQLSQAWRPWYVYYISIHPLCVRVCVVHVSVCAVVSLWILKKNLRVHEGACVSMYDLCVFVFMV
jgi:hypothetical protein